MCLYHCRWTVTVAVVYPDRPHEEWPGDECEGRDERGIHRAPHAVPDPCPVSGSLTQNCRGLY